MTKSELDLLSDDYESAEMQFLTAVRDDADRSQLAVRARAVATAPTGSMPRPIGASTVASRMPGCPLISRPSGRRSWPTCGRASPGPMRGSETSSIHQTRLLGDLAQDRCLARLGPGARRDALSSRLPTLFVGCGSHMGCDSSGTVTRRGSRGDCPARSSTAHLAVSYRFEEGVRSVMTDVIIGVDPHKLSVIVGCPGRWRGHRLGVKPTDALTDR